MKAYDLNIVSCIAEELLTVEGRRYTMKLVQWTEFYASKSCCILQFACWKLQNLRNNLEHKFVDTFLCAHTQPSVDI